MATPILNWRPQGGVLPPSDGTVPTPQQGNLYYWPQIDNLAGGDPATDLDAQNISILPADSLIIVTISGRGESQWLRTHFTGLGAVTDLNGGIIVPTNYDIGTRPWVLYRQLGF